jgi:glutathione-regulated potassium-efflux system ancillary protein KefC
LALFEEKYIQPRFADGDFLRDADTITHDGVEAIIAGHGRFGMTIGRVLKAQGYKTIILEQDASQVDALRKFGFKVFYGDALRLDLLESAGAKEAKILIIAIDDKDRALELVQIAQQNYPNLKVFARAYDRSHAHKFINLGVNHVFREVYGSSMDLAQHALVALGKSPPAALRIRQQFTIHDENFLREAAKVSEDQNQLIDLARQSRIEIGKVFAKDRDAGGET